MSVNKIIQQNVNWDHLLNVLADKMGCPAQQKEVAERLGLTEGNYSMKKKRGTLLADVVAWCLKNKVSVDYVLGIVAPNGQSTGHFVPEWLLPYVNTLDSLNEVDQGRVLGALQLLGLIKLPEESNIPKEDKQAVAGMPRSRDGTR